MQLHKCPKEFCPPLLVWFSRIYASREKMHNWCVLKAYVVLEHEYMNISD